MKKSNKNLSIFQILKQNTSIKGGKNIENPRVRKESIEIKRKNSSDIIKSEGKLPLNQIKMIKTTQKFNASDSESMSDKEDPIKEIESAKRRRKGSMDLFLQQEKDIKKKMHIKNEKINQLIRKERIMIEGDDSLKPVSNFTKMIRKFNLDENLIRNIQVSGYKRPTPIQMIGIPAMFKKRNLIALAPTGSGKTAAFAIPLITMLEMHKAVGLRGLVLAPTYELANQLSRELIFLNNQISNKLEIKLITKLNTKAVCFKEQIQFVDILVTTPLKFLKLVKKTSSDLENVEFLVLDEADKYFELGLANQIKRILELFKNKDTVISMFSATIQYGVEELLNNFLVDPIKIMIGGKNNVLKTIEQKLVYVGNEYGKRVEIQNMISRGEFYPPVLIFVQSKERATDLYDEMMKTSMKLAFIHNDRTKEERDQIITDFRTGKLWVLICTDLIGRGIDFKGVNLVINYDFPNTMINYIHRVGRTGRANRKGKAITFYTDIDKPLLRSLGNMLKLSGCDVPDWIFSLKKIDRKEKKHLEKFPVKRESISTKIEKNIDPTFKNEMFIKDKIYLKKMKKIHKETTDEEEEENA